MHEPPADVTDPVLWRLAVDVAAHHQPGPNRACAHPFCAGAPWPCHPYRLARRAEQLSRRPTGSLHKEHAVAAALPVRTPSWVAIPGHAAATVPLSPTETAVLTALGAAPATADQLAARTRLRPDEVAWVLHRLAALRLAAPLTNALPPEAGRAPRTSPPPYRRL
jgi:hypothetical protein